MSRMAHSIKNAKVALLFYFVLLLLNFFSRRIFIEVLGNDLVGLTASVQSYIGMLNLADLGISAAIAAVLYLPLYNSDQNKIKEIVSIYGYLFRKVGIVIGICGVILSLFLPVIFAKDPVDMWAVYISFYTFLITTMMSYLVNYKQNLLVANQKNYVVVYIQNMCMIAKIVIQIALLKWFGCGLVAWLAMELVSAVVFAIWLEIRVNREYPWLKTNIREGKTYLKDHPDITKNIKRVFSHKIAGFTMQQTDNIVIQLIMGVSMVTYYGNYMTIVNKLIQLIVGTLSSNIAGVGNLVAEGDQRKIKHVFWQMNAMFYWIGGVVAVGFYTFASPLVTLWIPEAKVFSDLTVFLLAVHIFIYIVRQPINYFVNAYALFGDTWAAWVEAILNLGISITLGIMYGVIGVITGTVISTLLVVIIWRPHYLYSKGFKEGSGIEYWFTTLKFTAILAVVWFTTYYLGKEAIANFLDTWSGLFISAAVVMPIFALVYGIILWISSRGMKDFVRLSIDLLKKKIG